jgi:putative DNA primase/helicase
MVYERERRAAAKELGIRASLLDRLVSAERGDADGNGMQGRPIEFPAPDPWPDPIDGAALLADLVGYFDQHLVLPERAPVVLALWSVHTYCFELFRFTPRLSFKSPTPRSGKSTAIALLYHVGSKPARTENITTAAVFRVVEIAKPTLLVDEADRFLRDNRELTGIFNSGYQRGGETIRCVGDDAVPRKFSTFAPCAFAGIGALPGTIEDRAIGIKMRRASRSETKAPVNDATEAQAAILARRAVRWIADHERAIAEADPDMGRLFARAAQIWRPLFAIAHVAGDNWPALCQKAAEALAGDADAQSLIELLIADLKRIFDEVAPATEVSTAQIVDRLVAMLERPWPEMPGTGKPITAARFTRMMGTIKVQRRRFVDPVTKKPGDWGYRLDDLTDVFAPYLDA